MKVGLFERLVERSATVERSLVDDPLGLGRRILLFDLALFVVGLVALVSRPWVPMGSLVGALATVLLGWLVGSAALSRTRRSSAFRSGWDQGRLAMFKSAQEAELRGLTPGEWLAAELERDLGRPR